MQNEPGAESRVEEIQGVYGPFVFPEVLLQRIWLQRDFDVGSLRTLTGESVEVIEPGLWNHLGGPDFRDARLKVGGREVRAAVEIHLYARDWVVHGHASDEAYGDVGLHVVLFPPPSGVLTTRGVGGREIPILVLLPWLRHDLEEYAAEAAVERLAGRTASQVRHWLDELPAGLAVAEIACRADRRWRRKVHYAGERIRKLGWSGACHHAALEILGYRFNRAPMLRVATRYPLAQWVADACGAAEASRGEEGWVMAGVRPANHPARRLRQYAEWVSAAPDWPDRWAGLAPSWEHTAARCGEAPTGLVRREAGMANLRDGVGERVCGGALNGPRLDTLICDGLLPLWAARTGGEKCRELWLAWYPGDQPAELSGHLKRLGIIGGRDRPASHGAFQGLLDWLIERSEM